MGTHIGSIEKRDIIVPSTEYDYILILVVQCYKKMISELGVELYERAADMGGCQHGDTFGYPKYLGQQVCKDPRGP